MSKLSVSDLAKTVDANAAIMTGLSTLMGKLADKLGVEDIVSPPTENAELTAAKLLIANADSAETSQARATVEQATAPAAQTVDDVSSLADSSGGGDGKPYMAKSTRDRLYADAVQGKESYTLVLQRNGKTLESFPAKIKRAKESGTIQFVVTEPEAIVPVGPHSYVVRFRALYLQFQERLA